MFQEELARHRSELESYLTTSSGIGIALVRSDLSVYDCNLAFMRIFTLRNAPRGEQLCDYLDLNEQNIRCGEELKISCSRKSGIDGVMQCYLLRTENGYMLFCEKILLTESHVLEQIGIMNNDLSNLQRELVKKNRQLEMLTKELDEKLRQTQKVC